VAMEVVPKKAVVEPREGRQRRKAQTAAKMTARNGERKRASTICSLWGIPPSRAKENIMRELLVYRRVNGVESYGMGWSTVGSRC